MKLTKAHRLWLAGAITLVVLISVTGAVMKKGVTSSVYLPANESASPLGTPAASSVQSFSNLGVQEFTHTLVKNVPVSGIVVIQTEQTSGDGNNTVTMTSGRVYRDTDGRTRYDELGETKGPENTVVEDVLKTTINDPAEGVSFIIDPRANTARRKTFFAQPEPGADEVRDLPAARGPAAKQGSLNSQVLPVPNTIDMNQALKSAHITSSGTAKRESLGRREIEGMLADGTRIVMTVPAGSMQNEKQIEIGCERWYSPSLKTLILVECSDSRSGKSSYRLTQIKTDPPPANLFKLSSDTKIRE
jgi:hypothetical protein